MNIIISLQFSSAWIMADVVTSIIIYFIKKVFIAVGKPHK